MALSVKKRDDKKEAQEDAKKWRAKGEYARVVEVYQGDWEALHGGERRKKLRPGKKKEPKEKPKAKPKKRKTAEKVKSITKAMKEQEAAKKKKEEKLKRQSRMKRIPKAPPVVVEMHPSKPKEEASAELKAFREALLELGPLLKE